MQAQPELCKDLVFVGGGHAHALALRMLAMDPIAGLRITLVSPASHTPYSGMLPGLVAGHYTFEETHIDLARLCQWAGVRFIASQVTALDPALKTLTLSGRPPIQYDVLSIDIGSQPELDSVPGARAHAVPVKPVAGLWQRWRQLQGRVAAQQPGTEYRLAVVGGGAGSVELALAMAHALDGGNIAVDLWSGAPEVLQNYNSGARRAVMAALADRGVGVYLNSRVAQVEEASLVLQDGSRHLFDELFWCTGAAAAPWVAASSLATDDRGFLAISDTLQSLDDPDVFGSGDIAVQVNHPRPKAGVYAVRQGPVLARNLRNRLLARRLREHHPQQRFLSLVSLGGREAAADKGPFSAAGKWVWRWKDRIDREFMQRFEQLPAMDSAYRDVLPGALEPEAKPYCGGCGAKVGARGLSLVLAELAADFPGYCQSPEEGDDASLIPVTAGPVIQSLDMLRQLVADPWLMGRIAANHALSDLYACGARPVSALAAVTLPFAAASLLQRDLKQVLSGALHEFSSVDCRLSGGHSMQGPELGVGFVVNGQAMHADAGLLSKRGAQPGDRLLLTKPLGTGVLFAAHMQQLADGRHIEEAIAMMLQSNRAAAELACMHGVTACTDVTGFGLLGHLLEMLGSDRGVLLRPDALPALPGALEQLAAGVRSSMHASNFSQAEGVVDFAGGSDLQRLELLFDPQTSGGLLIAVPAQRAAELSEALSQAGCAQVSEIGEFIALDGDRSAPRVCCQ